MKGYNNQQLDKGRGGAGGGGGGTAKQRLWRREPLVHAVGEVNIVSAELSAPCWTLQLQRRGEQTEQHRGRGGGGLPAPRSQKLCADSQSSARD